MAFIDFLRHNKKIEKCFNIVLIVLMCSYLLAVMTLSSISGLNYFLYPLLILLFITATIRSFLYSKILLDYRIIIFAVFILVAFVSTLIGTRSFSKMLTLGSQIVLMCSFFLSFSMFKKNSTLLHILLVPFIAFALLFFIFHFKQIIRLEFQDERLGSVFGNVNDVSIYFLYAFIISITLAFFDKRYYLFAPATVFAFFMLTTGTKKTFFLAIICLLVCLFLFLKKHKIVFLISSIVLIVLIVVLLRLPFMSTIRTRTEDMIISLFGGGDGSSTWIRTLFMESAFYRGLHRLIIGHGADGFLLLSGFETYSHANFSEVFCCYGLIGFFIYYCAFPTYIIKFHSYNKLESAFNYLILIVLVFFSFSTVYYYSKIISILFVLMMHFADEGSYYLCYDVNKKRIAFCGHDYLKNKNTIDNFYELNI